MALVTCPACGRQISIEADACPQCGHPNRLPAPTAATTKCYACAAPATTRCQSCGALSCAQHLQSIFVPHWGGWGYELRCQSCYSSGETGKIVLWVFAGIVLIKKARGKNPWKSRGFAFPDYTRWSSVALRAGVVGCRK